MANGRNTNFCSTTGAPRTLLVGCLLTYHTFARNMIANSNNNQMGNLDKEQPEGCDKTTLV